MDHPATANSTRQRDANSPPYQPAKRHKPCDRNDEDETDGRQDAHATNSNRALSHEDYTVAWICALHMEMAAAQVMLDELHPELSTDRQDSNNYVLGKMHNHNVVIACLPSNQYGIVNAASVAVNLKRTFGSIDFALMVGIGGGAPSKADVRLGDVVVGARVMQSDLGKLDRKSVV